MRDSLISELAAGVTHPPVVVACPRVPRGAFQACRAELRLERCPKRGKCEPHMSHVPSSVEEAELFDPEEVDHYHAASTVDHKALDGMLDAVADCTLLEACRAMEGAAFRHSSDRVPKPFEFALAEERLRECSAWAKVIVKKCWGFYCYGV